MEIDTRRGRTPSKEWSDEATSQGRGVGQVETSEGAWTCHHLDVRFLASRTGRRCIAVVLSHPVKVTLLQQHYGKIAQKGTYRSPGAKEALQGQNKEDGLQGSARSDFENDSCHFRREFGVEHLNQGSGENTHIISSLYDTG